MELPPSLPRIEPQRVAILALGTRGNVQPYFHLARALATKFTVKLFAYRSTYLDSIHNTNVDLQPIDFDLQKHIEQHPRVANAMASCNFIKYVEELEASQSTEEFVQIHAALVGDIQKFAPDILLTGAFGSFIAQILSEKHELPAMRVDLQNMIPTREQPCPLLEEFTPSHFSWVNLLTWRIFLRTLRWDSLSEKKQSLRKYCGLSPIRVNYFWRIARRPLFPTLVCVSKYLFDQPRDWSLHLDKVDVQVIGPLFKESNLYDEDQPEEIIDFLNQSLEKPVYIGWGSMSCKSAGHLTELAIRALMLGSERGILLRGWANLSLDAIDPHARGYQQLISYARENVLFVDNVSHEWLFRQCKVIVHHGGAGTTHCAIRSGIPSVITPVQFDQSAYARMLGQSGCGIDAISLGRMTSETLAKFIDRVQLPDIIQRAREVGDMMLMEKAVENVPGIVEKYLTDYVSNGKWKSSFVRSCEEMFGYSPKVGNNRETGDVDKSAVKLPHLAMSKTRAARKEIGDQMKPPSQCLGLGILASLSDSFEGRTKERVMPDPRPFGKAAATHQFMMNRGRTRQWCGGAKRT